MTSPVMLMDMPAEQIPDSQDPFASESVVDVSETQFQDAQDPSENEEFDTELKRRAYNFNVHIDLLLAAIKFSASETPENEEGLYERFFNSHDNQGEEGYSSFQIKSVEDILAKTKVLKEHSVVVNENLNYKLCIVKDDKNVRFGVRLLLIIQCYDKIVLIYNAHQFVCEWLCKKAVYLQDCMLRNTVNLDLMQIEIRKEKIGGTWFILRDLGTPSLRDANCASIILSSGSWDQLQAHATSILKVLNEMTLLVCACNSSIESIKHNVKLSITKKCHGCKGRPFRDWICRKSSQVVVKNLQESRLKEICKYHVSRYFDVFTKLNEIISEELFEVIIKELASTELMFYNEKDRIMK